MGKYCFTLFSGEWTAEFAINGSSKEDYQRFARAQLDVYGRASFGWTYWTYKCNSDHWNLKWMLDNSYITLNRSEESVAFKLNDVVTAKRGRVRLVL